MASLPERGSPPKGSTDRCSPELWQRALQRVQKEKNWAKFCELVQREEFATGTTATQISQKSSLSQQISQITQTVEKVVQSKERASSTAVQQMLAKTITILKTIKDLGTTLTALNPYASLAWGVVQFMVSPMVSSRAIDQLCCENLPEILHLATQFQIFEEIYEDSSPLKTRQMFNKALEDVYVSILEYQIAVVLAMRSRSQRLKSTFLAENLPQQALDKVTKNKEKLGQIQPAIDRELTDTQFVNVQRLVQDLKKDARAALDQIAAILHILSSTQRDNILNWVSPILYENAHNELKRQPVEHTADWLFSHKAYVLWNDDPAGQCLWLRGFMGCGKSCLVHAVIDNLIERSQTSDKPYPVLFFYCDGADAESMSHISSHEKILQSLLKQLVAFNPTRSLPASIVEAYEELNYKSELTAGQCIELMASASRHTISWTVVLDGIDECPRKVQMNLIQSLKTLVSRTQVSLKLFLACRDTPDLRALLRGLVSESIDVPSHNKTAIHKMVESRVGEALKNHVIRERYCLGSRSLEDQVIEKLAKNAGGMFRWVETAFEYLHSSHTARQLKRRLQGLGRLTELWDLYQKVWDRAVGPRSGLTDKEKQDLVTALRFLIYGRHHEINEGAQIIPPNSQHIIQACRVEDAEELVAMCPAFLILSPRKNREQAAERHTSRDQADQNAETLQIPHVSVSEFLRDRFPQDFGTCVSNGELASLCMQVFLQPASRSAPESGRLELEIYAALSWPEHLRLLKMGAGPEPDGLKEFLLNEPCSEGFRRWNSLMQRMKDRAFATTQSEGDTDERRWVSCANGADDFDDASWFVTSPASSLFARMYLCYPWQKLDDKYLDVTGKTPRHRVVMDEKRNASFSALTFAALIGDTDAVRFLASRGHSPNKQNAKRQSSGHLLCGTGLQCYPFKQFFSAALQALIEAGLDLDIKNDTENTCFFDVLVTSYFDDNVLQIFINKGFDIYGSEPLTEAPWGGVQRGDQRVQSMQALDVLLSWEFQLDDLPPAFDSLLSLFCKQFPEKKNHWLCYAARHLRSGAVKRLVGEYGADPDALVVTIWGTYRPLEHALITLSIASDSSDTVDYLAPLTLRPGVGIPALRTKRPNRNDGSDSFTSLTCFEQIVMTCSLATVQLFVENTAPVKPEGSDWGPKAITCALLYNTAHGKAIAEYFVSLDYRNSAVSRVYTRWRAGALPDSDIGRFGTSEGFSRTALKDDHDDEERIVQGSV